MSDIMVVRRVEAKESFLFLKTNQTDSWIDARGEDILIASQRVSYAVRLQCLAGVKMIRLFLLDSYHYHS